MKAPWWGGARVWHAHHGNLQHGCVRSGGDPLSLVGNLADLELGEIFQIVSLSRRSGTLQLNTPRASGEIVFSSGKVFAVFRTDQDQSIGEQLMQRGVLTPTLYQSMLGDQGHGVAGLELFKKHNLSGDVFEDALDDLLKRMVYGMFEWQEGAFSFVLEDQPDAWRGFRIDGTRVVTLRGVSPQYLAIEGARQRDEDKNDSVDQFLALSGDDSSSKSLSGFDFAADFTLEDDGIGEKNLLNVAALVKDVALPQQAPAQWSAHAAIASVQEPLDDDAGEAAPNNVVALRPEISGAAQTANAGANVQDLSWRFLVVDDDPQVAAHIRDSLQQRGVHVDAVGTVADALFVLNKDYQRLVVVCDLIVARSDGRGILGGVEVLENVRKRSADMPFILFTDYQNEEAEARAKTLGVGAVLNKPRKAQIHVQGDGGLTPPMRDFLKKLESALSPYLDTQAQGVATPAGAVASVSGSNEMSFAELAGSSHEAPAVPNTPTSKTAPRLSAVSDDGVSKAFDLGSELAAELAADALPDLDLPPILESEGDLAMLRSIIAELRDPSNRDQVTLLVLRFASSLFERACLFLATRRGYMGLGGFSQGEGSEEFVMRVRKIQILQHEDSIFHKVSRFRTMVKAQLAPSEGNRKLLDGMGGGVHSYEAVAVPLVSGDRVAAILYGDNPSGKQLGGTGALEIFMQQAGMVMERALLERRLDETRRRSTQ